jgi:hypothetical protein
MPLHAGTCWSLRALSFAGARVLMHADACCCALLHAVAPRAAFCCCVPLGAAARRSLFAACRVLLRAAYAA